jgi:hypothetical protein
LIENTRKNRPAGDVFGSPAFRRVHSHQFQIIVWDTKRQIIWLVAGISFGTYIVYMDAHDETGRFDRSVFAFWEIILLAIILTLFFLYSRKKS